MGMKDGLPENSMFPKDGWSVVLGKKTLYLALQGKQLCIQFSRHLTITGIVALGNDQEMALDERSMIGNDQKSGCLFKNIGSNIATLTKCTVGTIPGGLAPILHADCSFNFLHSVTYSTLESELSASSGCRRLCERFCP